MSHDSLTSNYQTAYMMIKYHNFSLTEIDNMFPYEKEIYTLLIKDDIDRQEKEAQKNNG